MKIENESAFRGNFTSLQKYFFSDQCKFPLKLYFDEIDGCDD